MLYSEWQVRCIDLTMSFLYILLISAAAFFYSSKNKRKGYQGQSIREPLIKFEEESELHPVSNYVETTDIQVMWPCVLYNSRKTLLLFTICLFIVRCWKVKKLNTKRTIKDLLYNLSYQNSLGFSLAFKFFFRHT